MLHSIRLVATGGFVLLSHGNFQGFVFTYGCKIERRWVGLKESMARDSGGNDKRIKRLEEKSKESNKS